MAKTLIILVLLFDGTLVQERYELGREMPVSECLQYGEDHREAIAEYKEFKDSLINLLQDTTSLNKTMMKLDNIKLNLKFKIKYTKFTATSCPIIPIHLKFI